MMQILPLLQPQAGTCPACGRTQTLTHQVQHSTRWPTTAPPATATCSWACAKLLRAQLHQARLQEARRHA